MSAMIRVMPGQTRCAARTHRSPMKDAGCELVLAVACSAEVTTVQPVHDAVCWLAWSRLCTTWPAGSPGIGLILTATTAAPNPLPAQRRPAADHPRPHHHLQLPRLRPPRHRLLPDHTIAYDNGGLPCECDLAPTCKRSLHRCLGADGCSTNVVH